jgi:Zn finger protein HypA/HybF involved in hydrogenase expression
MSEESKIQKREAKFAHLRANVQLRRTGYTWFIVSAILLFLVSLVDIMFLDSVMEWGIIGALGVLVIWALVLFFSRAWNGVEDGDVEFEEIEDEDFVAKGDFLRCKTCMHVFRFELDHVQDEHREHVAFNCPECGTMGYLPSPEQETVKAPVPGGEVYATDFSCGSCDAHWTVGAIGHEGKADVGFEACPHCGVKDQIYQS